MVISRRNPTFLFYIPVKCPFDYDSEILFSFVFSFGEAAGEMLRNNIRVFIFRHQNFYVSRGLISLNNIS